MFTDFLVKIERSRLENVKAWCLVTIDEESERVVNVEGCWESPYDALAEGQRQRNRDREDNPSEEKLWRYEVTPFFEREK